jgi:hypothetical protein
MRRTSWITASSLLLFAALAGCRDGVVSPTESRIQSPTLVAPAPISSAPQGRPTLDLIGGLADSASVDFSVSPNGGIFFAGNHAVVFPAGSVCDPATSGYGPGTWDLPCAPLQSTLKVHAEVRRLNGQSWVDFSPSLRFAPSSNPAKWVWMVMYTPDAIGATSSDLSKFNILWASKIGGQTVDETPSDSSLRTYVDTWQGIAIRRIKHFTGYAITSGRKCDPAVEECPTDPPPGG